jgi:hypothetical protein
VGALQKRNQHVGDPVRVQQVAEVSVARNPSERRAGDMLRCVAGTVGEPAGRARRTVRQAMDQESRSADPCKSRGVGRERNLA